MSSGGKGKMMNVASFIKQRFNIVENSLVFMLLLVFEKLMDLEFTCPGDRHLAVRYSLVFLVVPTAIVGCVACYLNPRMIMCCNTRKRENSSASDEEEGRESQNFQTLEISHTKNKTKSTKCRSVCDIITRQSFWMKAVGAWMLIVYTDGRYMDCLVNSAETFIHKSNISNTEPLPTGRDDYLIHMFQITGLVVFLLIIIGMLLYRICCKSKWYKKMNEDMLLQITEDTIEEEARKRQREFVVNLLSREGYASFDPGQTDALEDLEQITDKWKAEIKKKMEVPASPKTRDRV